MGASTPKAVLGALVPKRIEVAGLELQPMTLGHWIALQHIESPFVSSGPTDTTALDVLRTALLLAADPRAAIALSRDARKLDALCEDYAIGYPPAVIPDIAKAIRQCLDAAFETALPGQGDRASPLPDSAGS